MRLRLLALALAFASFAPSAPARAGGGTVLDGQAAPELALADGLNGANAQTTIASLRGKVVCLKFWLTGCPVCRGTLPEFQRIHERYGRSGVVCLGVVIDNADGVRGYLREAGWTFAVGCDPDGRNASRYGVNRYPADYVIGADGVVRASNGFPKDVIESELRKVRAAELGAIPAGLEGVRESVEDGDYGEALRRAEAAGKAPTASAEVKAFVEKVTGIARTRQDNRLARVDALKAAGKLVEAKADAERIVTDFKGTSLEARARERLESLSR
ncbi:MAG: TlpA disulfide reductase family protein [Planctomycetota bacterium]